MSIQASFSERREAIRRSVTRRRPRGEGGYYRPGWVSLAFLAVAVASLLFGRGWLS